MWETHCVVLLAPVNGGGGLPEEAHGIQAAAAAAAVGQAVVQAAVQAVAGGTIVGQGDLGRGHFSLAFFPIFPLIFMGKSRI